MDTHEEIINADINESCPVSFPGRDNPVVNAPDQGNFPSSAVSYPLKGGMKILCAKTTAVVMVKSQKAS